jgi:hypothetical protein
LGLCLRSFVWGSEVKWKRWKVFFKMGSGPVLLFLLRPYGLSEVVYVVVVSKMKIETPCKCPFARS